MPLTGLFDRSLRKYVYGNRVWCFLFCAIQYTYLRNRQFVASEIIIFLVINSVEKLVSSLGTCYDIITSLYKVESIFGDHQQYSFVNDEPVELKSISNIYVKKYSKAIKYLLLAIGISSVVILVMPWTQNVESYGKVTTLNPENRHGCTGGQHRSVYAAEKMAEYLKNNYPVTVVLQHIEQDNK